MFRKFMKWLEWKLASKEERERILRNHRIGALLKQTFGSTVRDKQNMFKARSIPMPSAEGKTVRFVGRPSCNQQ